MLYQVGHPPQDASDIATQIVRLTGHSASPQSTAFGVKCFAFDSMVLALCRLDRILLASCSEQENLFFFELAQNTPMAQTWKTQVDTSLHTSPEHGRRLLEPVFLHCKQTHNQNVTTCHMRVRL